MSEREKLRRQLWSLADEWERRAKVAGANEGMFSAAASQSVYTICATALREALTYPAATSADEEALQRFYGKSSEQLADEAEEETR